MDVILKKRKSQIDFSDTYLPPKIGFFNTGSTSTFEVSLPERKVNIKEFVSKICKVDDLTKNSILKPGLEQLHELPLVTESIKLQRKKRKLEREKTKGDKWFNMPATEMTEEIKNDLTALQMRSILNPKHFYKKNDLKVLPKYFQVGTVMDNAEDFYHARVPKKQRKQTLVEELLADAQFKQYNKKKYVEIKANQKRGRGAKRHMNRQKKKK